jgi:Chalcone isomerase-like
MREESSRARSRSRARRARIVLPRAAAAAVLLSLFEIPAGAGECSGVTMPERLVADGAVLRLNGLGLREATVLGIDVYVAALYLSAPERSAQRILAVDAPRQIRFRLLREVAKVDMAANIERGFRRAAGAAFTQHAGALAQLMALIPPLAAGDSFAITSVPGVGVRLERDESVLGTVRGSEFARTLFSIWLGEPPLSAPLKAGLLGAECGA